jgi:hypothetical protein
MAHGRSARRAVPAAVPPRDQSGKLCPHRHWIGGHARSESHGDHRKRWELVRVGFIGVP